MGKAPKLRLSFLNSIQICRPNNPSTLINPSLTSTSTYNSISLPTFPDPQSKSKDKQRLYDQLNNDRTKPKQPVNHETHHVPSTVEEPPRRFKRCGSKDWTDKQSFVVVKRSTDPYKDFKKSMMEMILEREILEPREMEQLLMMFVSLNSRTHHKAILKAFSEIWREVYSPHSKVS